MSSIIYYKFLHQKNRLVIHFDGTSISVFDLKREIILQNHLGTGHDFNLKLYHSEQPDLEYELDQDVIPRSSFVLVKRSPSNQRGGGGGGPGGRFNNASRYVSGKPRMMRKFNNVAGPAKSGNIEQKPVDENISEEDRIKLMFQNQSEAWAQTQDELAQHKMIYYKPVAGPTNPEDVPPPGYICYRCGKKDHWIKNCPTNSDPTFEGKKILRSTGIPRSYLKTISKHELEERYKTLGVNENGDMIDQEGNAILLTEEGDYAIAVADSKTWSAYQEKQSNANLKAKQEFETKMIETIEKDQKLQFLDPLSSTKSILKPPIMTTSCCPDRSKLKKLSNIYYNQADIEQILIANDFYCPNCNSEDIFIDSLIRNESLEQELQEYITQKEAEIGIENPNRGTKRQGDELNESDPKRMNLDANIPQFPPFVMPPVIPGSIPPGMPIPPMPVVMNPMFLPPPPTFMNMPAPPIPTKNINQTTKPTDK
jgi:protein MPE1